MNVLYTAGMDKPQICAELDKLGVPYNKQLGVVKLQAILDEALKKGEGESTVAPAEESGATAASEPQAPEVAAIAAPIEPAPAAPSGVAKVLDSHGFVCRTYTLEEHGDQYVELAQSFAQKKGLRIA